MRQTSCSLAVLPVFLCLQRLCPWQKLPAYMAELAAFAGNDTGHTALLKAAILRFDLASLHPYFDGNGRMTQLLHLWYLVQCGYSSALFVPLSRFVEKSRARYYKAYRQVEQNQEISGVLDLTPPFLSALRSRSTGAWAKASRSPNSASLR